MNKNSSYIILIFLGVFALLYFLSAGSGFQQEETEKLTFSQFRQMLTPDGQKTIGTIYTKDIPARNVFEENPFVVTISPTAIEGRYLKPGVIIEEGDDAERIRKKTFPFRVEIVQGALTENLQNDLNAAGYLYKFKNPADNTFFSNILYIGLFLGVLVIVWFFLMRQLQSTGNRALSFGKSKARFQPEGNKNVNFGNVAGCDEAKQELVEVVDFLKDPRKFQAIGAKIPRGVLLVGPPGTGKTLLARAVSGEAGVPFFSISGSDFVEMFVGVGASRVRDLFEQAKKNAPCIIFIDEIDAVGRLRGAGLGGGHDEREQTLNQMLVEMDGFEENEGVIVMAATNRPDVLDPALLRPGRFDRQVVVDAPDVKGREEVLRIHAKKVPLSSDVNLKDIARGTPGFTGADLANLINEAALLSARRNKKQVHQAELEEAKDKVMMGPERRSFLITPKEKKVIAYHEGGHALLGAMLPYGDPVHKVTIIPRGRALGITWHLPEDDKYIKPSKYWHDRICSVMGGYLAEELIFGDTSTGASNDIQVATNIARRMVTEWGMSERLGTIAYSSNEGNPFLGRDFSSARQYSDETASAIDEEVKRIVQAQLDRGRRMMTENQDKLETIAQALLTSETISAAELYGILGLPVPQLPSHPDSDPDKPAPPEPKENSGGLGLGMGPEPVPAG